MVVGDGLAKGCSTSERITHIDEGAEEEVRVLVRFVCAVLNWSWDHVR